PDVLFLNHEGSNFKTIQLDDIFNFLKTRAVELDQKYIVVSNVLGLSPLAQNKLLKVLEEPPVKATFFFLNPNKIKMLETIHSRAQKAMVIIAKQEQELIKPSEILTCGLVEFQEQYKSDWKQIRSIIEA